MERILALQALPASSNFEGEEEKSSVSLFCSSLSIVCQTKVAEG
jgi:hypothetical protein